MSTPDFDAAVISASPLGLTEALLLAHEGKRVLVCDERAAIGGAWRVETAFGYADLEVGCHIFIPSPIVPLAIKALWNVRLAPLTPPPLSILCVRGRLLQGAYAGVLLPGAAAAVGTVAATGRWLLRLRRDRRLSSIVAGAMQSAQLLTRAVKTRGRAPGPLLYPPGGTGEILRALSARARDANVTVRLSTRVIDAQVDAGGATLRFQNGTTCRVTQLVLTRGSRLQELNGLTLPRRMVLRRHWVAVLDDPTPRAFSYLQFSGHPAIERVSDVTSFATTEGGAAVETGRKIVCVYAGNALYERGADAAETTLLQLLKTHKWIGARATPARSGWWEDTEASHDYGPLVALQEANPAVRIVPEINLGMYLQNNLMRWRQPRPAVAAHES